MTTWTGYIEPTPTGGSSLSHLASRNPYRAGESPSLSGDDAAARRPSYGSGTVSRNPYTGSMTSIPRHKPLPPSREASYGSEPATGSSSRGDDIYSATPPPHHHPLFPPPRPDLLPIQGHGHHHYHSAHHQHQERRPSLPPRPNTLEESPRAGWATETTTLPTPALPPRPQQEQFFAFRRRMSQISSSGEGEGQVMQLPPRRLLTTDDVPVNSVGYTRNPEKVIAYLIPLPTPIRKGQPMKVPQVSLSPSSLSPSNHGLDTDSQAKNSGT